MRIQMFDEYNELDANESMPVNESVETSFAATTSVYWIPIAYTLLFAVYAARKIGE